MKYIIKIFSIFFVLFLIVQNVNGEDINPIRDITYKDYLSGSTIVNINGDLQDCNLISISGKKINSIKKEKQINFKFDDLKIYNGIILINCNGNLYKKDFFFPYIKEYKIFLYNNLENIIEIKGENFKNNANIFIGEKRLRIIQNNDRYIIAYLPKEIKSNEVYIKQGNLKSNLVKLNIQIPEIKYIKSDNGFKIGTTLKIYTKNFSFSPDNFILINKDKYQLLAENYKDNYFYFKIPEKYIGENKIAIIKNGVKSNTINFKIFPNIPIIKQITPGIDKDSKKILKIKGENFINTNKLEVKIGKNGINLDIKSINNNEIIVFEDNNIKGGNNYIYIRLEDIYSNIYNYFITPEKLPFIGEITTEGLTPDNNYRIFRLTTNYFNKKTDGLTLNGNNVRRYGYYGSIIKAQIRKDITKGYFGLTRNQEKLNYIKVFDFSYEFSPVINYINIKGEAKYGTKVEIIGKNFLLSKISANNLLGKKDTGEYDISISDSKITGYLPKDFDPDRTSSLSIENNGLNVKINFIFSKINKTKINGPFILNKIVNTSNNFIIKQGDTLNIFGSYFHITDKIFINDKKIDFEYINPTQIKVKLDDNVKPGAYELKIKNNIGIETKLEKIFIFNKKLNPKVKFYEEKNNNTEVIVNPINGEYKNKIFKRFKVENLLNDLQVNKVIFKVENYDKDLYLNLFDLYYNNRIISSSIIDNKGYIVFDIPFIIKKDLENDNTLTIEKDSPYIKQAKVKLKLEEIKGVFLANGEEKDASKNIEINNLDNTFNIIFKKEEINNCVNIKGDIISCDNIENSTTNTTEQKKQQSDKDKKINNSKEKITYLKLLVNSRHKLSKTNKGKKYLKQIDALLKKYQTNKKVLEKLKSRSLKLKEKIKNKKGLKYITFQNIVDYLYAKTSLELLKIK